MPSSFHPLINNYNRETQKSHFYLFVAAVVAIPVVAAVDRLMTESAVDDDVAVVRR